MVASRQRQREATSRAGIADGAICDRSRSALFLSEVLSLLGEGASFLDRLTLAEIEAIRRYTSPIVVEAGETVFAQGDQHSGIFLIDAGRVRTYYAGPSGKEITLAYWTPGHFVGGPEVFGRGVHVWSATAEERSRLSYLPGARLRRLAETTPSIAVALIEGLVAKGKCYSALVQMLGTRSVTERLAHLLLILATVAGHSDGPRLVVDDRITHEQLAGIVGSTRQWVTSTLSRFQRAGVIEISGGVITILRLDELQNASC